MPIISGKSRSRAVEDEGSMNSWLLLILDGYVVAVVDMDF